MRLRKITVISAALLIAAGSLWAGLGYAAGITIGSGASVTLSGSPAITTVDINNSGSLSAAAGTLNLSGDWTNSGTFNAGTSTFSITGSGTSTVNGTNTFYNFSSVTAGKAINFTAASTQNITNNFTLTGASGSRISLRSTASGSLWNINPQGAVSVNFADVKDSNNTNATVISPSNSLDSGNNPGWRFGSLAFTSAAQSILIGVESDPFDFSINYLNSNSRQRDLSVGLASDSVGPYEFRATSGGTSVTSVTVPNGSNTGTFFYLDNHAGTPTVTISATGYTSGTQQVTVSSAVFTLAATTPQIAGSAFTLTITAKDSDGNTLTAYSGTVNLTPNYVSPSTGTGTLGVTSTSAFVNGVATITNQTFSDCGTITITATDASTPSATGTSASIDFRPFDFSVTASSLDTSATESTDARHIVNKPFTLEVTARNAQAEACPNYTGDTALSVNYISPSASQTGTLAISSLGSADFSNGVATLTSQGYDKWGTITITATDATLTTQAGTSANIVFLPQDFSIALSSPPPARDFYYTDEEFSATVSARDFNAASVANYKGSVTFSASGLNVPADYTFTGADSGSHTFSGISGSSETSTALSAKDSSFTSVTGASSAITIKSATINVVSTTGPVGTVTVTVQVLDSRGNLITSDNSTAFTITVTEFSKNGSVTSRATINKVTVSAGIALISITNTEAETVTVSASSTPLLSAVSGVVRFGTVSGGGIGVQFWREIQGGGRPEEAAEGGGFGEEEAE